MTLRILACSMPFLVMGIEPALAGSFSALAGIRGPDDRHVVLSYNSLPGEISVHAPATKNLTSISIDSASGIFTSSACAQNLDGRFDNASEDNIFKATFLDSFGSLSFGAIAQTGLAPIYVANDLTVVGSIEGGGGLGDVYLCCPEPSPLVVAILGVIGIVLIGRRMTLR